MYRIFLVEDDETIAKLVRRHLEKWDYDVHVVQKFDAVMSEFASFDPHLVLMDIGLPFYNGYHWCTEIRRVSKVPVVFLSSAADNMNIVMAVSMGADDFIAKPFDLDVLTVKIQAIIRRCYDFGANNSVLYFCHDLSPQPVPKPLFCDNKALKPYRIQLFTQPVDIHRKCILVHIRITLPQLFH